MHFSDITKDYEGALSTVASFNQAVSTLKTAASGTSISGTQLQDAYNAVEGFSAGSYSKLASVFQDDQTAAEDLFNHATLNVTTPVGTDPFGSDEFNVENSTTVKDANNNAVTLSALLQGGSSASYTEDTDWTGQYHKTMSDGTVMTVDDDTHRTQSVKGSDLLNASGLTLTIDSTGQTDLSHLSNIIV